MNLTAKDRAVLRKHPLFAGNGEEIFEQLSGFVYVKEIPRNALLFQYGDPYFGFFIVLSGVVKLYRNAPSGRQMVMRFVRAGESFAEAPIARERHKHVYLLSAESIGPGRVLFFPAKSARALLKQHPSMYPGLMRSMSTGIEKVVNQFAVIGLYPVPMRLLFFLNDCIRDDDKNAKAEIRLTISKKVIAGYLGTVPETLSRAFRQLSKTGLIQTIDAHTLEVDRVRMLRVLRGEENIC